MSLERENEEEEVVVVEEEDEEEAPLEGRRRRPRRISTDNGNGNGIDSNSTSMSAVSPNSSAGSGSGTLFQEQEPEAEEAENEALVLKFNNNGNGNGHTTVHDDAAQPQDVKKGGGLEEISVHFDKEKGTESTYGLSGMQYSCDESYFFEANPGNQILDVREKHLDAQNSLTTVTEPQSEENLKTVRLSSFDLLPSLKHGEVEKTSLEPSDNGMIQIEDVVAVEEIDKELPELDIEGVLRKQDTHDLFCPNCNSCITRRVILRKRKRKIQDIHPQTKRDKLETIADTELDVNSEIIAHNNDHDTVDNTMEESLTPAVNYNDDRGPEIFRCLSCFSFFIPIGNNFKLSRIFGDRKDNEEMQNHQQSATNDNRFFSIFAPNKGKMAVEQGDAVKAHSEVKFTEQLKSPLISKDIQPQPESGHSVTATASKALLNTVKPAENVISKPEQVGYETIPGQDGPASSIQGATLLDQSHCDGGFEEDATIQLGNEEKIIGFASTREPILLTTTVTYSEERSNDAVEINKTGVDKISRSCMSDVVQSHSEVKLIQQLNSSLVSIDIQPLHKSGHSVTSIASRAIVNSVKPAEDAILKPQQVGHETQPGQDGHASSFLQSSRGGFGDGATTQLWKDKRYIAVASTAASMLLKKAVTDAGGRTDEAVEINKTEDDLSLVAGVKPVRAPISNTSEETEGLLESRIQIDVGEQGVEAGETHGWDILKSIVYGGLIESITSLGVVTSAAGAGAAVLNVLALGLANLIGGLFIIANNLWELRNDQSEGGSSQIDGQVNRYNELLGRRENFTLHMVVAVLSYLVFGLVPPVVYGLSFRKSGDRDYKLAAVSAASLFCIILLALGKGHVRKPPKSYIKTLLYYVSIAIMASGVSYVAGSLIKKLLEKLGWLDSSLVVTAPFPGTTHIKPAWSSY